MANRVSVAPELLVWARKRSGRQVSDFAKRFPKLEQWESGALAPTMRQLENYAKATHTPIGFFFLHEPPVEEVPLPDFRTFGDEHVLTPTPDLLDTVYACELRQDWYRDFAQERGYDEVGLVGSFSVSDDPEVAAGTLRDLLGFGLARRADFRTWSDALNGLRDHAEDAGVLVMINGVVGSDTHRKLNPKEFRGFALADKLAPVVFVNGADTKAAQIFTLAHELAHLALGGSALSRPDLADLDMGSGVEAWCNRAAAELLVPRASIAQEYTEGPDLTAELDRLAKLYKVSTLVVLRRIYDAGLMPWSVYRSAYQDELARVLELATSGSSGGNFYNTEPIRVSRTFARALVTDTNEGRTLHRDAFRLLGFKKFSTFEELSQRLGAA
ncbi:ImmA/IrrE family metallo-endopeptidase [Jatrophihabitans sp.]|uniref:ImmA/IrrE family metallo-endopeptidase n=1 Tax=Jatrophihabitans sp. TaxID=1932789 RepID=UPI002BF50B27|nr:ImmA/IrrE family metallo-endopeptidase [Jatrophihabitans sp.]